jgi:hypothetical protein
MTLLGLLGSLAVSLTLRNKKFAKLIRPLLQRSGNKLKNYSMKVRSLSRNLTLSLDLASKAKRRN